MATWNPSQNIKNKLDSTENKNDYKTIPNSWNQYRDKNYSRTSENTDGMKYIRKIGITTSHFYFDQKGYSNNGQTGTDEVMPQTLRK